MRWDELAGMVDGETIFGTDLLYACVENEQQAQRQVADWARAGKVTQLRRGLYALTERGGQQRAHPFVAANRLAPASYVSLQMALSYYSLIPEHVTVVTSVTTGRPGYWDTSFGRFHFRHIQTAFFYGFEYQAVSRNERAFVATPEKALLDLVYLQPGGDEPAYLTELRLQNLDQLDVGRLFALAQQVGKPKLIRAAQVIADLAAEEAAAYQPL